MKKRALANGYLSILTEGLYEDINSFNITRDWYTDDKDMEYFSSIDAEWIYVISMEMAQSMKMMLIF